jgi:CDP-glucose 4,6-dehydratase
MDSRRETTWRDRRVLVTGHTGFKGAWLWTWLEHLGARVEGLALPPATSPSLHELLGRTTPPGDQVDVRDAAAVLARLEGSRPEVVFHLAAQSLVRRSFDDPVGTFATNVMGTANMLDAARAVGGVRVVVVVTSDKVYEPRADGAPHDESSPLGGIDPYSASKAATEHVVTAFRRGLRLGDAGVCVVTARAGNVIGGGDWAPDRIVADVVRARAAGEDVRLRYPQAVRPWQHVLDPLAGYLQYAEALLADPRGLPPALNFGPADDAICTVADLVERLAARFGGQPRWVPDPTPTGPETAVLRLSADLARRTIGWEPRLGLDAALDLTARWYAACERGDDLEHETIAQIASYENLT